jgi:ADP-ribose pyrophosphatase
MFFKSNHETDWQLIHSEPGPQMALFRTRYDWVKNPRNEKSLKAIVLETADWVNVVALTPEKKILVVRQFRFGIGKSTTEIPAGLMDAGETSEHAAARELLEETGYTAREWKYLGWVQPNPAFMDNLCHQWLAVDVTRTHAPHLDEGEAIISAELSLEEVMAEINAGEMRNSITLLTLARVFDLRDGLFG